MPPESAIQDAGRSAASRRPYKITMKVMNSGVTDVQQVIDTDKSRGHGAPEIRGQQEFTVICYLQSRASAEHGNEVQ